MKYDGFFTIDANGLLPQPEQESIQIFGRIEDILPVCTLSDYIAAVYPYEKNNTDFYDDPRMDLIEKIIRLQVALYLTRRTSLCQSVSDGFLADIEEHIKRYKEIYKHEYIDPNDAVSF
ncbi:hypothetical protein [Chryseobacterium populi]|uniref:Uncharacterized protein n=1 Tax=Chryseobacterium populi TaxID=1144316 RepID=J3CMA9_9FLAO|nr:hypothetical protein [Chryseobacterium populi]EJL74386.1 hypothetical protein PMI13_01125 [Chryseobacterium populi]